MKKFPLLFILIICFSLLCGCISDDQDNTNNNSEDDDQIDDNSDNTKASLKDVCLKVGDLPKDYLQISEDEEFSLWIIENISPEEVYGTTFSYKSGDHPPGYPVIVVTLVRYENIDNASYVLKTSAQQLVSGLTDIMDSVNLSDNVTIGNESIRYLFLGELGEEYNFQENVWCFIYFRVDKIVCFIMLSEIPYADIDYDSLIIYYAEIIEERIKNLF